MLARFLFAFSLLLTALFFSYYHTQISIDTDLKDLTPSIAKQADLSLAIDNLSNYVERRFTLVIKGPDVAINAQAATALRDEISAINGLRIEQPETQLDDIARQLTPYRFNLLTDSQRSALETLPEETLVENAKRRLFQLSGTADILTFEQDPLGLMTDYLNQSLAGLSTGSTEAGYQAITVSISGNALEMSNQRRIQAALTAAEETVVSQYPVTLMRSGVFFFAAAAAQQSKKDISLISTGSMIGVLLLLLLVFRSLRPMILPVLSIATGVATATAVTHFIYGSIHVLTIVFGASLIGIVIDYSLHYCYHRSGNQNHSASRNSLYRALMLSLITSVIGYGALGLSSLDALTKVAVFSCSGLIMAWLTVICCGPWIIRKSPAIDTMLLPRLLAWINSPLNKIKNMWLGLFAIITAGFAVLYLSGIPGGDDPRLFFSPSQELLEQEKWVSERISDFEPGRYFVVTGSNTEEVYQRLGQLHQAQELESPDNQLISLANWLPSAKQQALDYKHQAVLYKADGVIDTLLVSLGIPNSIADNLRADYNRAANRYLEPDELLATNPWLPPIWSNGTERQLSFALLNKGADIEQIAMMANSTEGVDFIHLVAMTEEALKQQRLSSFLLLGLAYLAIALLLLVRYKKLSSLAMLAVPAAATMCCILLLSTAGIALTLFHTMALFLVLGLGMDYVIFAREMTQQPKLTQQAILLSAITSLLSFGLLSISSIPVAQAFGLTVLIGNTINLLGTLLYALHLTPPPLSGEMND